VAARKVKLARHIPHLWILGQGLVPLLPHQRPDICAHAKFCSSQILAEIINREMY
jgi:hypothetical protein